MFTFVVIQCAVMLVWYLLSPCVCLSVSHMSEFYENGYTRMKTDIRRIMQTVPLDSPKTNFATDLHEIPTRSFTMGGAKFRWGG